MCLIEALRTSRSGPRFGQASVGRVASETTELLADGNAHRLKYVVVRAPLADMPAEASALQCLATAKTQTLPSRTVATCGASVAYVTSGASMTILQSCA